MIIPQLFSNDITNEITIIMIALIYAIVILFIVDRWFHYLEMKVESK